MASTTWARSWATITTTADYSSHYFVESGGTYTSIVAPFATSFGTVAKGINDSGQVVGVYDGFVGWDHGFVESGGTYITIDHPLGVYGTVLFGINNLGQVVGYYNDADTNTNSFVLSGGIYSVINVPLAVIGTYAYGINDSGQVVGQYFDGDGNSHGFVATAVPEPSSLLMSSLCVFAGLAAWLRRRRSAAAPAA